MIPPLCLAPGAVLCCLVLFFSSFFLFFFLSSLTQNIIQVYRLPSAASGEVSAGAAGASSEEAEDALVDDWEYLDNVKAAEEEAEAASAAAAGGEVAAATGGGLGLEGISLEDPGGDAGAAAGGDGGGGKEGPGEGVGEGAGEAEEQEPVEVVSERLLAAFLNGLKKTLKDTQLPMLVRWETFGLFADRGGGGAQGVMIPFTCA